MTDTTKTSYTESVTSILESVTDIATAVAVFAEKYSEDDSVLDRTPTDALTMQANQLAQDWTSLEDTTLELLEETEALLALSEDDGNGDPDE